MCELIESHAITSIWFIRDIGDMRVSVVMQELAFGNHVIRESYDMIVESCICTISVKQICYY